MNEGHTHHHSPEITNVNKAFIVGIVLNFCFVIIEVSIGLSNHSLSLISDAGHNLADVGALVLSLIAYRLLKIKPTKFYTYGYRKTSILVALFNAMVLMLSIGIIVYEAFHRFFNPEPLSGKIIAIVAGIGIIINSLTALLFFRDKEKDLNVKSAYLHLMSDAIVSLGIVVGGIIILYTNWFWVDSLLSIIIAIVIFFNTWGLLKDSLRLSLDGVPNGIEIQEIIDLISNKEEIIEIHHVHIWAISTSENAMTAHIVFSESVSFEREIELKNSLKHTLFHKNIHHITFESEKEHYNCASLKC